MYSGHTGMASSASNLFTTLVMMEVRKALLLGLSPGSENHLRTTVQAPHKPRHMECRDEGTGI